MKVKQRPADFLVTEINTLALSPQGAYAVYQLTKEGLGTIEAVNELGRLWKVRRMNISIGGLKDKHAQTSQLISIAHGPRQDFTGHTQFNLKYLGQSAQPISPQSITRNHFRICLRDLRRAEVDQIRERLNEVAADGLPNYFDEQRFGSVRGGNEFPAKQLIQRDYEGALKTALTATAKEDRRATKDIRQAIQEHWGDWEKCFRLLPRSSERSIINYLKVHPTNFRQAFELLDENLVLLYLHAYQSYLWNKALNYVLEKQVGGDLIRVPYLLGDFIFYRRLPAEPRDSLTGLVIPFLTHRSPLPDNAVGAILRRVLAEEQIDLAEFRIRGMKKTYFRKGQRAALMFPQNLAAKDVQPDELNRGKVATESREGKVKLTLEFELPRGAYATILIKRISYDFTK